MAEDVEESAAAAESTFGLPEEVLEVLPSDPFAQLDVARKITSLALANRVSALESEAVSLRHQLSDKDQLIADLRRQLDSLDAAFSDASDKLAAANQEKEALLNERDQLSSTVKKLNRDVSKLEVFRKTLMQSIQEDDDSSSGVQKVVASSTQSTDGESRLRISPGLLSSSQTSTPRYTPPGSPPVLSASASPKTSNPVSPRRRHSIAFSTSGGMLDIPSVQSSNRSSFSSNDGGSQARARVDGKEFFRQVRSRLSYEQFGAFLANVKELNSHKQTKEETLRKAEEIFGSDNRDLYTIFEGLLFRNAH